jgi:hypothetical protein
MRALRLPLLLLLATALALPPGVAGAHELAAPGATLTLPTAPVDASQMVLDPVSENFELVGHSPLGARGMNAALAVHNGYAYVGSRTDGLPNHQTPGILVVDVRDPAKPEVVHEIGAPDAGLIGETSRELRVWPQRNLLIVMNFKCSELIHACSPQSTPPRYTFFDISGENAAKPKLVATYLPSLTPHEAFLWVDPHRPAERALLYSSTPTSSQSTPSMVITDLSKVEQGVFPEVTWAARNFTAPGQDRRLHSMGVSNDGTRTYLAFLGAGFLVLDTSEVARGVTNPRIDYVTKPRDRASWGDPGDHTAVKLFGRDIGLATDEVYGDLLDAFGPHGCPWGWVRLLDLSDQAKPKVISEYKVEQNQPEYCDSPEGRNLANTAFTSYSAHNPTFTDDLAFVTWHSAGLEVIDLADPANPKRAGKFKPTPLPAVATEDPALSSGLDKVVMWSYPIIVDGLIYVIDLRNGLYILKYTGPRADEIAAIDFLEGNSNLGDALVYEPVAPRTEGLGGATLPI